MPQGRTADVPDKGPVIFAGRLIAADAAPAATPTP
jgi:hypothetical protein